MSVVVDGRWLDLLYRCDECGIVRSWKVSPTELDEWAVISGDDGQHHFCPDCADELGFGH